MPGTYTVRVTYKGESAESEVNILPDPRLPESSKSDMQAKDEMIKAFMEVQQRVTGMADQLREAKASVKRVNELAESSENGNKAEIMKRGKALTKELDELYYQILSRPVQGIFRDPKVITNMMFGVASRLQNPQVAVNANTQTSMDQFKAAVEALALEMDAVMKGTYAQYRAYVKGSGLKLIDGQ